MLLSPLFEKFLDWQDTRDLVKCIVNEVVAEKEVGYFPFVRWEICYNKENVKKAQKIGKILKKKFKRRKVEVFAGPSLVHAYCAHDPSPLCVAIQVEW